MKKLNLHFKIVILISALLIFAKDIYSQWTVVADLGVNGQRPRVSVLDENTAYATGGQSVSVTIKTTNGGINWIQLNTSTFFPFWAIHARDANTVFAGDDNGVNFYKSINGGTTWTIIDSLPGTGQGNFQAIRFSNSIPSFGIALAQGDNADIYLYKTRDGGNTWARTLLPEFPGYISSGGLDVIDSLFYAFGTVGNTRSIIITTDGGATWNLRSVNLPLGGQVTRGLAFKEDKLTGIVGSSASNQFISRTTDGGLSWVNIDVGNHPGNVIGPQLTWIEGTNICYYTSTRTTGPGEINGVLKSTDGGYNWNAMTTTGLGILYMDTKKIGSNIYGYANSAEPGAFGGSKVLKVTDMITGVNQISEFVPDGYSLSQNYPNPFNPKTIINYQLSMFNFVSLKIYDVLGNEVASLVNEKQNAGTYEVDFDGSIFSSGVYFYKFAVDGNIIDTKRMVLLK